MKSTIALSFLAALSIVIMVPMGDPALSAPSPTHPLTALTRSLEQATLSDFARLLSRL
ncbi:MAG: hypothetical protein OHK0012_16100 [Synechococcales cyanobacterium]